MATLFNTKISNTYPSLIKSLDNAAIGATLKELSDGSGNALGIKVNTAGDFSVPATLSFGSLKDIGENITITKFVDANDGIGNNNNDTSIPTSKAVKDYVDTHITAQDLDFTDGTNSGAVDLDSQSLAIIGTTNEIETSASNQQLQIGIVTNPALSGNVAISGNIDFADGAKARFGNQDLEIYHDGSHSYIEEKGTGNLKIYTNDLEIKSNAGTETLATFATNGAVSLYHDDTLRLSTSSSGLSVTGKISNLTDPTANQDAATKAYVDSLDAGSDLDFSGDSGTGDVNLNTQTFAVTGTTNQITTSASNQTLNLSLPSTVHRNLQGNVTGNLTGNVTGNVTGDLTGNVTATSVLADGVTATTQQNSDNSTKVATTAFVKNLNNASDLDFGGDSGTTGAVVLNTQTFSIIGTANEVETSASNQQLQIGLPSSINVNSASATILQTARDISLTGEASATISSFNGSSNVSGAVTLDNNSVTGKVLTGLASPTASNILASDTILEAFGKTQSQLNTLAGGLRFMGTWNANTNTPTLTSGGGEADSGTTTGTATNKLIDSSQNFTSTVTNGDKVINQASGSSALVTNVDSNTQLTLDADIMVSGQEYTIDNSPFITQGHYFVVSVGGTSSLNGLSNWAVGDWVIAGAGNVWEKLDHTQVDGTGTAGNITKWSSTNVIADSIMAESGSTITVTGGLTTTQNLLSEGTLSVYGNATIGDNFGDNHTMNGQLIQTSTEGVGIKISRRNGTTGLLVSSSGDSNVQFGTDNGSGSNTHHWTIGKDNSDNAFRISAGSVLGTGDKIKITGSSTTSYQDFVMGANDIKFADNGHIYLGDSNDLDLYHDSSNSYIKNNIGSLLIQNTNDDYHVIIQSDNGGGGLADYFRAKGDTGEAILYHYGNQKLATTTSGIKVENGTAGYSVISADGNGGVYSANGDVQFYTNNSAYAINFYNANKGAKTVELSNAGHLNIVSGNLGLGDSTPDFSIEINHANPQIRLEETSSGGSKRLDLKVNSSTSNAEIGANQSAQSLILQTGGSDRLTINSTGTIKGTGTYTAGNSIKIFEAERSGGAVKSDWSYHDSNTTMSFGTSTNHSLNLKTNDTVRIRVQNNGNIGVGTENPQNKFVVANGTDNTQNVEIAPNYIQSFNRQSGNLGYASLDFYAQSYMFNQGDATFAKHIATQIGGFSTTSNVNSTGDAGVNIANGCRLGFDQSGTRSWTFKAYSGNFNLDSGDGNGKFSTGTKGINAGDIITVNKSNSGQEGGGLLLRNAAGGSGAYNRIYFAPTSSDYTTRSCIIQGENLDGNNNMALVFKTSAGADPVEHMRIDQHGDTFVQGSGFFVGNNNTSGVTEVVLTNKDTSLVDAGDIQNRLKMRGLYYDQSSSLIVETQICSGHESSNGNGNSFLAFFTQSGGSSPTEKIRITSAGDVGIGSASPSSYNSRGQDLVIKKTGSDVGITIAAEASGGTEYSSSVMFADGTGGTSAYRGFIEYHHDVDHMSFGTAATERFIIQSTGVTKTNSSSSGNNESYAKTGTYSKVATGSGTAIHFVRIGHTHAVRFNVIAKIDTSNVGTLVGNTSTAYGSNGGIQTDSSAFIGNVTGISVAYDNSFYGLEVTVTYSGSTNPQVYLQVEGMSSEDFVEQ